MMKFEYGKRDEAERKCVAFIDAGGDLCVKGMDVHDVVWLSKHGVNYCIEPQESFDYQVSKASHRFYHGDSITITF